MSDSTPPVIGGMAGWAWFLKFFHDQARTLMQIRERHGPLVALEKWAPFSQTRRRFAICSGASLNRAVLSDPDTFYSSGPLMRGPSGSVVNSFRRGLIGMNGQKHADHRRMVASLLIPRAIAQYYQPMVDVIDRHLSGWDLGKTIDVSEKISELSLDLSAQNLLGGGEEDDVLETAKLVRDVMKKVSSIPVVFFPWDTGSSPYSAMLRKAKRLDDRLQGMIDRRKDSQAVGAGLVEQLIAYRRDHPNKISESELKEHAVVLFTASHETTARAVVWTLFLLSQHPEQMARVYRELRTQVGDEMPTMHDLNEMRHLEAVVRESMRLFPPVTWVSRRVQKKTRLANLELQRGDSVILNHLMTHREPDVFEDPLSFRPERWTESTPDRFAYVPYSSGPRTCIGKALGDISIKLLLTLALQRFKFTMVPNARVDQTVHVTLSPRFGLPMRLFAHDDTFQSFPVRGSIHSMVDLSDTGPQSVSVGPRLASLRTKPAADARDVARCPFHHGTLAAPPHADTELAEGVLPYAGEQSSETSGYASKRKAA